MAMISRMKLLRTSLQATRTMWMTWPRKESAEDAGLSNENLFDEKNRLLHVDPGRFVLFNGRWYFPPVTVRPTFELWDYPTLSLVEPKGNSHFSSLFSQRNLHVAAGVAGLAGLCGIGYYAVKYYKKRTLVAANHARKSAPIGLAAVPFLVGRPPAPGRAAVLHQQQQQPVADPGFQIRAVLQPLVMQPCYLYSHAAPGHAAALHLAANSNLTTKQKIKEFLKTRNVHAQQLSLEEFLSCLDLKGYLVNLQGRVLEDLATLSFEDMAELGIRLDHRVQMKNGINYLMDLHNKSLVFAPVPNAA